jgi:hypothetical protein
MSIIVSLSVFIMFLGSFQLPFCKVYPDFVSFEKYANAALSLESPSSAARALDNGAIAIERVDKLVQAIALQNDRRLDSLDVTVSIVDGWLEKNRLKEK